MDNPYIVIGDARSGTSLVAGLLHNNGIKMADNMKEPNAQNPYGFYEDYNLRFALRGVNETQAEVETVEAALDLIDDDKCGFKCVSWMVDDWEKLEPHINNPNFIVTKRDIEDQAESIRSSLQREEKDVLVKRVKKRMKGVKKITDGHPSITVHFDDWFNNCGEQMKKLCEFVDIDYSSDLCKEHVKQDARTFGAD